MAGVLDHYVDLAKIPEPGFRHFFNGGWGEEGGGASSR